MQRTGREAVEGQPVLICDSFSVSYSVGLEILPQLRERIRRAAQHLPFTKDELDDISMAFMEGASNAFRHGRPPNGEGVVRFLAFSLDSTFVVRIADAGPGFDPDSVSEPDPEEFPESGMGIYMMRRLMDEVVYRFENGTVLELTKRVRRRIEDG
jgi:serine/threonine-protein kinase RsbW